MRDVQRRDSPVWHSARGGWRESNVPGRGRPASQPRGGGGSASRPSVPRADGTVHSSPPFPVGGRYRHVVTRAPHRLPAVSAAWGWSAIEDREELIRASVDLAATHPMHGAPDDGADLSQEGGVPIAESLEKVG